MNTGAEKTEKIDRGIAMSVALHGAFFAVILFSPNLFPSSKIDWGSANGSEGIKVNIVGSIAGIALPAPPVVDENAAANDSKGLNQPPPAPPVPASTPPPPPVTKAEPVPDMKAPIKKSAPIPVTKTAPVPNVKTSAKAPPITKPAATPSKALTPTPANAIPFGGPKPDIGYGSFQTSSGNIGIGFGDGAFGTQFGPYVQAMQRRISSNWLQGLIDPSITHAPRVTVTFDILRDGTITNYLLKQSSGYISVDRSAERAILKSSPLNPLPRDYSGSKVSVSFYFEYVH